jgi:hypothetical protein
MYDNNKANKNIIKRRFSLKVPETNKTLKLQKKSTKQSKRKRKMMNSDIINVNIRTLRTS